MVKFNLNLNILLPITDVITLNVLEVNDEVEFFIGVELSNELILKIAGAGRLLIPTNSGLSKVYPTYFSLESQVG